MSSRRLACLLLGLWLGGDWMIRWMASGNLHAVNHTLDRPNAFVAQQIKDRGRIPVFKLLTYQAAEQNRLLALSWENVQIGFAIFFFFYLLFGTREGKYALLLVLLMMAVVIGERLVLTPELIGIGRSLDFSEEIRPRARTALSIVENVSTAAWLAKSCFGLALAGVLMWRRSSGNTRKKFDLVDKSYNRHINR
jgi:hypothetical protein